MTQTDLDQLTASARAKKVSRRQFMQFAIGAGLSATAATKLWTTEVQAATPSKGGTFRVAIGDFNTTDTLDPARASGIFTIQSPHICRTYLTEITPENQVGPDSAESWEATPDAKNWRFKLAKGQEFHNGKPMTATDVVSSLNHHRGEDSKSGGKALLADVDSIETDGADTVVIKLKVGTADLPYMLADYHFAIMPDQGNGKVDADSGIGAGPYKVTAFQPGVSAEFVRHERYHRESWFDAIQLLGINDVTARMNSLIGGIVDTIADPDPKLTDMLTGGGFDLDVVPSGTQITMDMDCRAAPFSDNNVRLAMKYALDRQAVLEKIAFGYGKIGNDHPVGPNMPYQAQLEQTQYDPDKARFHLKKAGLDTLSVQLSLSDAVYAGAVDMGNIYQQSAAQAGINIDVIREPADSYWSNVWLKKAFCGGNYGQRATPDMIFSTFFRSDAPWNFTHWENDRFQKLLIEAKAELDETKRAAMYGEMQSLCREESGTIVAFFQSFLSARSPKVKHQANLSSEWQLDGGRAYHRWWFES